MYDRLQLSHRDDYYGLVLLIEHYDIISKNLFKVINEYFRLVAYVSDSATENEIIRFKDDIERLSSEDDFWQLSNNFSMLKSENATWEKDLDHFEQIYGFQICGDIIEQLKIYILNMINLWNYLNTEFDHIRIYNNNSILSLLKKINPEIKYRLGKIRGMYDSLLDKSNVMLDNVLEENERNNETCFLEKIKSATGCYFEVIIERDAYRVADGIVDKIFGRMKEDILIDKYSFFHEFAETVQNADSDYWALSGQDYPRDEETANMEKSIRSYITEVLDDNTRSTEDDYVLAWLGRSEKTGEVSCSLLEKPSIRDIYYAIFSRCWKRADEYDLIDDPDYDYYGRHSYDYDEDDEDNSDDEIN
ncbi:hypothetical protein SAMN05216349_13515 [Oribacterium sp. KHPX15]|uniref:hypothetical protein n=1 Tax=Oribacterium sp. KHPX15 TaxID=1855342 RepID=UPI000896CB74|nr:hypothetical protein [Oribacterium sp. KHPX15]SEA84116.1 hypothetical protein SAMN05216349_13515 [Oribacterium sp. KHPX15]